MTVLNFSFLSHYFMKYLSKFFMYQYNFYC